MLGENWRKKMKSHAIRTAAAATAGAVLLSLVPGTASAQTKISGTFAITTLPPGTTFNATAAGIAKLFNAKSGARMRLREAGATLEVYVARGETQFGLNASPSSFDAWSGSGIYKGRKMRNIRTVMVGPVLYGSLMATKSSGMKTIADLKGKRVPARFAAMPTFLDDIDVIFAAGGIGWKDIKPVPVAGIRENYQAFMDGLTDVANASIGSGVVNQADAKHKGVRFLGVPPGDATAATMTKVKRGYYPITLKQGSYTGIIEDTTVWAKDILVNSNTKVSDEVAYQFIKLFYNNLRELDGVHPVIKTWTKEGIESDRNTLPMHNGSIRFLKEIGKWTDRNEKRQKELLAMP
jgi:TRAP transporter TAXI family solute receptor